MRSPESYRKLGNVPSEFFGTHMNLSRVYYFQAVNVLPETVTVNFLSVAVTLPDVLHSEVKAERHMDALQVRLATELPGRQKPCGSNSQPHLKPHPNPKGALVITFHDLQLHPVHSTISVTNFRELPV